MAADARVCEGATVLLHTLAFTALLTWSPGIEQSQAQPVLGSLLLSKPTAPSRQTCPFSPTPGLPHPLSFPYPFLGLIPPIFEVLVQTWQLPGVHREPLSHYSG